jgi:ferredoxin
MTANANDQVKVTFERGEARWEYAAERGSTLLEAAHACEAPVDTLCHGIGACIRCKVILVEGELTEPTPLERDRLGNIFHLTGERLACQAKVCGDVRLKLNEPRKRKRKMRGRTQKSQGSVSSEVTVATSQAPNSKPVQVHHMNTTNKHKRTDRNPRKKVDR